MYELSKNVRPCTRTPSPIKGQFPPAVVHLMLCAAPPCQSSRPRLRFEHFKGSPHDMFKIVRFRNGPLSVKSLVSTSPILGAPRERAHHSAVASAALAMSFRCRRRRSLASVRGQRKAATPCHQRKQRAYLKTRGPKVGHLRTNSSPDQQDKLLS